MTAFLLFTLIALKIPVCLALWILWRAWDDAPDQVVGAAADNGGGGQFMPGPRKRGPHGGSGPARRTAERQQEAHTAKRELRRRSPRTRV